MLEHVLSTQEGKKTLPTDPTQVLAIVTRFMGV